jgi:peptidoglycan hydrolase-like protein with peptidoglycan-binding domain
MTPEDWDVLYSVYNSIVETVTPDLNDQNYPGSPLSVGDSGDNVSLMQIYLNKISDVYSEIPRIEADGIFGPLTKNAVEAFQRRFNLNATGIIDLITWVEIVEIYNFITNTMGMTE